MSTRITTTATNIVSEFSLDASGNIICTYTDEDGNTYSYSMNTMSGTHTSGSININDDKRQQELAEEYEEEKPK